MSRVGITVEGGLLTADLVERIALGDETVAGQKPKDFGLEAGRLSAEIQAAFSDIRVFWDAFKRRREHAQTSAVTLTREGWVIPLLERLGYALRFQRAGAQIGDQRYSLSHWTSEGENATPVHIVAWNQPLGQRGEEKRSPHALLQEYLNKSDALWGIVTNGSELRLLRNSARSSRPSYIAIDLETILDGNLYNEFALAFRLLHRSRLPADGGDPHDCLLETWYQQGIVEGGRVRDRLRDGVKAALETLGTGFLGHPANAALRARLDNDKLTDLQLYRELLNLIYRLLFLMVAEERGLLFTPEAGEAARHEVYLRWYGIGRLRDRAERRSGEGAYGDLWEGLKETFRLFRDEDAAQALALTALNGELFGLGACFDLEDRSTALRNSDLLDAIRPLSTFEERAGRKKTGVRRRVSYAGLDVEELGSIYESLLDYHPQVLRDPWRFALTAGSQRKETGSYYTPPELVRELVESALVPVMEARRDAAKTREEKERALLSLTICDPAAGSGHFLLAAARRVGRELAIIRSGEAEPAPETYRAALRDVIRHCLYAVDKNPLAVDLCKVALWIEGHAPGLPLSFLDHRIRCGDSLIGVFDLAVLKAGVPDDAFKRLTGDDAAVCSELRRRNRQERAAPLDAFSTDAVLANVAREFAALADHPDQTPGDVRSKEELYRSLIEGEGAVSRLRRACDAWTATFFAPRGSGQERTAPTTADVWNALAGCENRQRTALIDELSDRFHFFHWRLEFPDVFGFDVMLGNPPWEVSQFTDTEFFSSRLPDIADLSGAARKRAIAELERTNPAAWFEFVHEKRAGDATNEFWRDSSRFPLTALGKINTYALFAELAAGATGLRGRAGIILPTGIATDATSRAFFNGLIGKERLASLLAFENEEFIFRAVHHTTRFCLLTINGPQRLTSGKPEFAFFMRRAEHVSDPRRRFALSSEEIALFNPNTRTAPIFRSKADAELTKRIYEHVPILIDEGKGTAGNPWNLCFSQGLFNMTSDSSLFHNARQLECTGSRRDRTEWIGGDGQHWLPLYEAKMIHHYDHRWATYHENASGEDETRQPSPTEKSDQAFCVLPRYWVAATEVEARLADKGWRRQWLIGWRDITGIEKIRTVIAAAIPRTGVGHTLPLFLPSDSDGVRCGALLANLSSLVVDYVARQKVGGTHLTFGYLHQLPILAPGHYPDNALEFIRNRVLELTYTAHDMDWFARDLGYDEPPFRWDPDRRALLRAELDAYFAYLYGLSRDELRYILDPKEVMGADYPSETFRVLKENEIRAYGEYRTRRLVLDAWDRFAEDGTFDPARLRDPTHFDAVQRALVETQGRVKSLERELQELLARSDATPLPTLFVEGESDVAILTAAWRAFHPTEPLPVTILAAGGTRQMESLAGKGRALRQVLGDRLVLALADNDREGRELVDDGHVKRGGRWRQQTNGIYWCLLAPTPDFEQVMKRFGIPENFWPFTIENAFPVALRRQAMADGAYTVEEAVIQASFHGDTGIVNKALAAAHQLDRAEDDAVLYFRPPDFETKLAFAEWVTAPKRRDRATFAAFGPLLDGLRAVVSNATGSDMRPNEGARSV